MQSDPVPEIPEAGSGPKGGALGKASAVDSWKPVKNYNFGNGHAIMAVCNVPPNRLFQAWVEVDEAHPTVDPIAVAFYHVPGASGNAYQTIIADANDDSVTQEPSLLWFNNTGVTQVVRVFAFAYNSSSTGPATLVVLPTNTTATRYSGTLTATPTYFNQTVSTTGCTGPYASRITLAHLAGTAQSRGIIAVNEPARTGGFIQFDDATVPLTSVLPSGSQEALWNPSYLVGYNSVVSADYLDRAKQEDLYSCN